MIARWLVLVASCAWTLGCAPFDADLTVSADATVASETAHAVQRWRVATGIPLRVVRSGGDIRVKHAPCPPPIANAVGCAPDNVVRTREPDEHVITHELGHVLGGPGHVSNEGDTPRGIMHYSLDAPGCITQIDLDWLCEHAACRWRAPEC